MALEYLPLLAVQRDLYRLPRGPERFRAYLSAMIDPATGDLRLPLTAMNPMGKDHVPELLDRLLALDADGEGARAMMEAEGALEGRLDGHRVSLVVCDDAMGGWTNRFATEFDHRFRQGTLYRRGFVVALLWTSEAPALAVVREEVTRCVSRVVYVEQHGEARTLGEMLAQEGHVAKMAGWAGGLGVSPIVTAARTPVLDPDDLAYTREVLGPHLRCEERPVIMAALFGDEAATELGYRPLGLSARAGLALALADGECAAPRTLQVSAGA